MKSLRKFLPSLAGLACIFLLPTLVLAAVQTKILFPLIRTAYQTNEWIDVSVLRTATEALPAGNLTLTLNGKDGSHVDCSFPVRAVPLKNGKAQATEHYHLNGYLLRPGKYSLEVAVDGSKVAAEIDVFSHLRQSDFRLINWGRANKKEEQQPQGEDSLGFNLFYAAYGQESNEANFLRAGIDYMGNCIMSGGHQMDLRMECDWSDPYVSRGGTVRVARRAFQDRTHGNVPGVHFYDEPGLTWRKSGKGDELTPHMVPSQVRSYVAAFGKEPLDYTKVDPKNPEHVARWRHWAKWKLGFMDAAWKEAQFGVSYVRPDYLSLTQSQYGWSAFTDGYYFNVVRSLPITSGHGGYHDFGPGYFNPSYFLELARARDHWKPCWYLPTWYGNTTPDQFRMEQYLSFQTNIQGMMSPPDLEPALNATGRQGIVESNHLMKKLGPIFTTMAVTKPPVAMLYSLSQSIHTQTGDMNANYAHAMPQGLNLPLTYLAGKLLQQQFLPIVDEDILDGTLAADHKAIILTSIDYLDPQVIKALESFIQGGGLVLLTGDSTVAVKGAVKLGVKPRMPDQEAIDKLMEQKKYNDLGPYTTTGKFLAGAKPLAGAVKPELDKAGIKPIFQSDVPTIVATRQAAGDIEYLFAVNATYADGAKDEKGNPEKNALKAAATTLSLEDDGRPIYDAIVGGSADAFKAEGGKRTGSFRFGPGQMRAFARTARPIGGIKAATPVLRRELVREKEPLRVEIGAVLLDAKGGILSGSAPLHVRVIDPLGVTRHEAYRATRLGQLQMTLHLAANDPAGQWKVVVRELLNNTEDTASFQFAPPVRATIIAGATQRAISFGNDLENVFRFARVHHDVTIVKGASAFNNAAAERLVASLKPWGVRCKVMDLALASKARTLTEEEARTWIGLQYAGSGQIKPGEGNSALVAGFAVQGPVILLGNVEDNPIIKFLQEQKFLPYQPDATLLPGVGRGMIAWQRDGVGHGQESVTLIAHDVEGIGEAVGAFFEAVAGLDPLTKWELPATCSVSGAKSAPGLTPAASLAWSVNLADRVDGIKVAKDGLTILTHDGSLATVSLDGKVTATKPVDPAQMEAIKKEMISAPDAGAVQAAKDQVRPDRMLKLTASTGGKAAVAYWGGTLRIVDGAGKILSEQVLPQDITALAWVDGKVLAGLANGQVLALAAK